MPLAHLASLLYLIIPVLVLSAGLVLVLRAVHRRAPDDAETSDGRRPARPGD